MDHRNDDVDSEFWFLSYDLDAIDPNMDALIPVRDDSPLVMNHLELLSEICHWRFVIYQFNSQSH